MKQQKLKQSQLTENQKEMKSYTDKDTGTNYIFKEKEAYEQEIQDIISKGNQFRDSMQTWLWFCVFVGIVALGTIINKLSN